MGRSMATKLCSSRRITTDSDSHASDEETRSQKRTRINENPPLKKRRES